MLIAWILNRRKRIDAEENRIRQCWGLIQLLDRLLSLSDSLSDLASLLGARLLEHVSANSEVTEQVQVGCVHETASNQIGTVVVASVAVKGIVPSRAAHKCSDKHLSDLRQSNEVSRERLGADVQSLQAIVTIHKGMNCVVHRHEVQTARGTRRVRAPAEKKDSDVMVPVQENKRLLAQNDKDGIDQFRDLAVDKEAHPKPSGAVSPFIGGISTDGLLERHLDDHTKQIRDLFNGGQDKKN